MEDEKPKPELVEEMVEALVHCRDLHRELDATKLQIAEIANELEETGEQVPGPARGVEPLVYAEEGNDRNLGTSIAAERQRLEAGEDDAVSSG